MRSHPIVCSEAGTWPFHCLSAFTGLIHRYTGQDEIVLAVASSGSNATVRVQLSDDPSFAVLIRRLQNLLPEPGLRVLRVVPDGWARELSVPGRRSSSLEFALVSYPDRTVFEYDEASIQPDLVETLSQHLARFVQAGLQEPDTPVSKVSFLTAQERKALLQDWIGTQRPYSGQTITGIFEKTARAKPDNLALIEGNRRISCAELNRRANQLGQFLRLLGVGPEGRVGICLRPSIEAVSTVLAILKAGAAYVPLEHSHPAERLTQIIRDAEISIVVSDTECAGAIASEVATLVNLDHEESRIATLPDADFPSGCDPDSAAYVLYTSGSTGRPNGVVGIHRSITNGLAEAQFDPDRPGEISCLNSPISVGVSLLPLFLPVLSGVPLVILSDAQMKDPVRLAEIVAEHGVTTIGFATPMLRMWLTIGSRIAKNLQKLRSVVVGGAPLTPDMVEAFAQMLPWATLENGYGSTEVGSIATRGIVAPGNIAIGRPVTNTRIYLLDRHLNPVPHGGIGEIYISSGHLARGYLNRPDLTSARFLPAFPSDHASSRMYKTGDLARSVPSGIQFLGRADDQAKIRGYRVHLSEVEAALAGCAGVRGVAVAAREISGEPRLVAYIVADGAISPDESQLRAHVRNRLPDYMMPTSFVWLERLPITEGGKVDRNALPIPYAEQKGTQTIQSGEPATEIERFLIRTWEFVLQIDNIRTDDHFLDLGGDSLFAVSVTARIWEQYDLELTVEDFFDHPTAAKLAAHIRDRLAQTALPRV